METLQNHSHNPPSGPSKIEASFLECAKKGYYLCGHCSRISHVGDYHEEEDGPPRCLHCKRISFMTWNPPVLEDDLPEKYRIKAIAAILMALALLVTPARAMDRFAALSMLETGNNDTAIGAAGEVSRYQIRPDVWNRFTRLPLSAAKNPVTALNIAQCIMGCRTRGARLSDYQWYLLWHRPGRIRHPKPREADRARRFANLCSVR
ncbi:MAG TPA: hypothetical protein VGJ73_18310 [Verrucomicrobiae bacterium]|jgi:hypothetical protein